MKGAPISTIENIVRGKENFSRPNFKLDFVSHDKKLVFF